jgi:hypothetical protein
MTDREPRLGWILLGPVYEGSVYAEVREVVVFRHKRFPKRLDPLIVLFKE